MTWPLDPFGNQDLVLHGGWFREPLTYYKRNIPSVSRFRFTRLGPKWKEAIKIWLLYDRELCLRILPQKRFPRDIFYLNARAVNPFRVCVAIFILVVVYSKWCSLHIYTVAQNKPDSTNQEIVSCCESYFKTFLYTIIEPYVRKVLEILFVILGLQLGLNYIFLKISQCIKYTRMTRSKI